MQSPRRMESAQVKHVIIAGKNKTFMFWGMIELEIINEFVLNFVTRSRTFNQNAFGWARRRVVIYLCIR